MFFSVITKNLNREILTKNLVTFKRWDGVKDEKFYYYGGSLKNPIFRGVVIARGKLLKEELGQFADLRGPWQKRGGLLFEGGEGVIPQGTLSSKYTSGSLDAPCEMAVLHSFILQYLCHNQFVFF